MNSQELIGWVSSLILLCTIGRQVYKQWITEAAEGVSTWLFVGQTAASLGFTVYSWMVENWVFVVTNALMLVNGLLGWIIVQRNKRKQKGRTPASPGAQPASA